MSRTPRVAEKLSQGGEGRRASIVSVDVVKQLQQTAKGGFIHASPELLDAVAGSFPQLVNAPPRFRYADHWDLQGSVSHHVVQRWKNLFVSEISGCSKENEGIRLEIGSGLTLHFDRNLCSRYELLLNGVGG
jgi:hypothetical protein